MMTRVRLMLSLLALVAVLGGCPAPREEAGEPPASAAQEDRLSVFVSIPPQAQFVERVGGEHVRVHILVEPGQSPATYEPSPTQMALLEEADVYFRVGVPFETALVSRIEAAMPGLRVVDTRRGITLRTMGAGGDAGSRDPHTWLDPELVMTQARTIAEELTRLDPEHEADYRRNLERFIRDLEDLDAELSGTLAPVRGEEMLVFHPAFGYLADAYGLEQVPIEMEGKEPTARQLDEVISHAREIGARVIFVQPQFATRSAEAIAREIGGAVVPIDPLARDYMANMREMARHIRDGLAPAREGQEPADGAEGGGGP